MITILNLEFFLFDNLNKSEIFSLFINTNILMTLHI